MKLSSSAYKLINGMSIWLLLSVYSIFHNNLQEFMEKKGFLCRHIYTGTKLFVSKINQQGGSKKKKTFIISLPHLSSNSVLCTRKEFHYLDNLQTRRHRAKKKKEWEVVMKKYKSGWRQFSYSCVSRINLNFIIDVLKCYDQHTLSL